MWKGDGQLLIASVKCFNAPPPLKNILSNSQNGWLKIDIYMKIDIYIIHTGIRIKDCGYVHGYMYHTLYIIHTRIRIKDINYIHAKDQGPQSQIYASQTRASQTHASWIKALWIIALFVCPFVWNKIFCIIDICITHTDYLENRTNIKSHLCKMRTVWWVECGRGHVRASRLLHRSCE